MSHPLSHATPRTKSGMLAQVYLGVANWEVAAIKVVTGGGRSGQAKLLHEIEILERCRSQHIVQFFGYSMQRNQLLLIMAYMPGGTLYDALHNLAHPKRRSRTYQFYNRWEFPHLTSFVLPDKISNR